MFDFNVLARRAALSKLFVPRYIVVSDTRFS